MRNIHAVLNEGDWVIGKTANDEKLRGYVERLDAYGGTALVKVLESDHDAIVGRSVKAALATIEPLPIDAVRSEGELLDLIDLALQTRDKAWFEELSGELLALRSGANGRSLRRGRGNAMPKSRVS